MERGLWRMDRGAPLNFTTVVRVTGPLTVDAVRAALPALRARHSHLRARIVADGRTGALVDHGVPPLSVRVVEGGGAAALAELEREINEPVASDPGPLARFTFLTGEVANESHLLVTLHHVVGDGMSGAFLARDLVNAASQALAGATPALPPLTDPGPLESLLPAALRGFRGVGGLLRFAANEAWVTTRHGRPIQARRDAHAFAHSRRTRVITHELDRAAADALAARARAEKTTVHGALSAAIVLGVLADAKLGLRGSVAFGSPVNVRARLEPPVGENAGFYVSMVAFRAAANPDVPFWDLARAVRRSLERDLARDAGLALFRALPAFFSLIGSERLAPRTLVERWEHLVPATTGLTNLGRLAIETRHGPLSIEDCWFAACPSALGNFLSTSTSLHGRIRWNFLWPDPVMTSAHATALTDDIVRRLHAALTDDIVRRLHAAVSPLAP